MRITQKNLKKCFKDLSDKDALTIVKLVNGTVDPADYPAGKKRINECYTTPSDDDVILNVINSILNGHGVDGVPYKTNAIHDRDFISYVNMGDTYALTILFNPEKNKLEISDWGSIYEKSPEYEYQRSNE